ncbi:antirestriction protein [Vibrio parahaemolyticus]|nr:antirestriction protein [Vibrio parahaemolyticus]
MITASIVPTQERPNFYPSMTSNYLTVEQAVYHFSDQFLPDYSGGYWEFVTLSNGGKFAYPEMGEPVAVNNDYNCASASLSKEAAGICIWIIMLGNCAMSAYQRATKRSWITSVSIKFCSWITPENTLSGRTLLA